MGQEWLFLSHVFRSSCGADFGIAEAVLDVFVESLDGLAKHGIRRSEVGEKFPEPGHESRVATLEPKGNAVAWFRDFVAVGAGNALDQAMQA